MLWLACAHMCVRNRQRVQERKGARTASCSTSASCYSIKVDVCTCAFTCWIPCCTGFKIHRCHLGLHTHIVSCLGFTLHVQLLYPQAQYTSHALSTKWVEAVAACARHVQDIQINQLSSIVQALLFHAAPQMISCCVVDLVLLQDGSVRRLHEALVIHTRNSFTTIRHISACSTRPSACTLHAETISINLHM